MGAALLMVTFGCADQPTAPAVEAPEARVAAGSANRVLSEPASVGWGAESRALVVQARLSPTTAARAYALLAVGQYGAALAADRSTDDGVVSSNGFGDGGRSRYEARRGAVAGASAWILTYLFPSAAAALDQRVVDEGEMGPGDVHPQFTRGRDIGIAIGKRMVTWATKDGFSVPWTGTIPTAPLNETWKGTTVAGAQHAFMLPYSLSSPRQFRSPPPPAFGSPAFLADLQEIRTILDTRRAEKIEIAIERNLSMGTITGLGFFYELASEYILEQGLDELAAARVLALVNAAGSDAVIACWDSKLTYFYIRPSQVDATIALPIGLPNHPSYPSGHSCISGAAAEVLTRFFPQHAAELQTHMIENGLSRMYAGIHYRFDVTAGQVLGRLVGAETLLVDRNRGLFSVIP
jgi:membrane-associated phospholipid phosphatase